MASRDFRKIMANAMARGHHVCVGLDPNCEKIPMCVLRPQGVAVDPDRAIRVFNRAIIEATAGIPGAFEPNLAFYARWGIPGLRVLADTINHCHEISPESAVILDAKIGDIGNTNNGYVDMVDWFGADAVTINPYLGLDDGLFPLINRVDKGMIILCRTSNKGGEEFQNRPVFVSEDELRSYGIDHLSPGDMNLRCQDWWPAVVRGTGGFMIPLYQLVALRVDRVWNKHSNCMLVVGATFPRELSMVRRLCPAIGLLIPGIGFQGQAKDSKRTQEDDLRDIVPSAAGPCGDSPFFVNSSRGIIHSSEGIAYADTARDQTVRLHNEILSALPKGI